MALLQNSACPHWRNQAHRCTVDENGIYIPLEDHILAFCSDKNYVTCSLFRRHLCSRGCQSKDHFTKRVHKRFRHKLRLSFRLLSQSGSLLRDVATASTIDISAGGMKIRSRQPLSSDSILKFVFAKYHPKPLCEGYAQVKWCNYEKDTQCYTAGLSFHDEATSLAAATHFTAPPMLH